MRRAQHLRSLDVRPLFHVLVPVGVGAVIYLIWRPKALLVFRWVDWAGGSHILDSIRAFALPAKPLLPTWMYNSLPQGLWSYACVAAMLLVWEGGARNDRRRWVCLGASLGVAGEFGQLVGFVPGRFDTIDLLLSAVAVACAVASLRRP